MSKSEQFGHRRRPYDIPAMADDLPHPSDIVVQRQVHSPAVYALGRFDGPLQFSFKTHEEALARATRFACREHLDAWYTTDGRVFERIAKHRPSVPPNS
jgi:hypothetical protein